MSRRLMIGYDGAGNSEDALVLGAVLASALSAAPLVASVVPYVDHLISREEIDEMARVEAGRIDSAARAHLAGLHAPLAGLELETRAIIDDSPARALHELIEIEHPLALVIGSAHRGTIGRVLAGNVGGALLSGASCAVGTAPRGYADRPDPRLLRIAVAVNESEESQAALECAISLARMLNASLAVLTVAEQAGYGYAVPFTAVDPRALNEACEEQAQRTLDRAIDRVPDDVVVQRRLLTGNAADLIADAASDHDLLVIGSRGYGPLRGALLGGVSTRLAGTAACPLLVLPRGAGDDPLRLNELRGAPARVA